MQWPVSKVYIDVALSWSILGNWKTIIVLHLRYGSKSRSLKYFRWALSFPCCAILLHWPEFEDKEHILLLYYVGRQFLQEHNCREKSTQNNWSKHLTKLIEHTTYPCFRVIFHRPAWSCVLVCAFVFF